MASSTLAGLQVQRWFLSQKFKKLKSSRGYQVAKGISIQRIRVFLLSWSHPRNINVTLNSQIVFYTKTLKFTNTVVFHIRRRNNFRSNRNFPILVAPSRNKHQREFRVIDAYFHKNFERHVNRKLSNKQRQSKFK